jgi:hypothetical protein
MKTRIFFAAFIVVSFVVTSACNFGVGHNYIVAEYYIYITGDRDRTVQISYLEQGLVKNTGHGQLSYPDGTIPEYVGGDNNVTTTETVMLPFFKEVDYVSGGNRPDRFLEITSANDTTTKAVMFHSDVVLADTFCKVAYVFNTSYGVPKECAHCKSLTTDSVLNYLKYTEYPCYVEFSQGDTQKRVSLSDVGKWEKKTGLYLGNAKR